MSNLIINTAYFTQKVFLTNINLATKPFLNITNMSVTGDISINNVTIVDRLAPSGLQIQNATKLDFNYNVVNNSTKIASSIGYSASATSATIYTLNDISMNKQSAITISNLNAGVYMFDYSYNINPNSNNVTLYQLYEYIDNTTTTTNLLTKNNTFTFTNAFTGNGNQYNTTYGILTSATNTVIFSIMCSVVSSTPTVNFSGFYLRYTRIA